MYVAKSIEMFRRYSENTQTRLENNLNTLLNYTCVSWSTFLTSDHSCNQHNVIFIVVLIVVNHVTAYNLSSITLLV